MSEPSCQKETKVFCTGLVLCRHPSPTKSGRKQLILCCGWWALPWALHSMLLFLPGSQGLSKNSARWRKRSQRSLGIVTVWTAWGGSWQTQVSSFQHLIPSSGWWIPKGKHKWQLSVFTFIWKFNFSLTKGKTSVTSVMSVGKAGAHWWNPTLSSRASVIHEWSWCLGANPVLFGMWNRISECPLSAHTRKLCHIWYVLLANPGEYKGPVAQTLFFLLR